MKRRTIKGLQEAQHIAGKPRFIPTINHRGSRQAGLIYERKVAERLADLYGAERVFHNPWFKYRDNKGEGWCCPDILLMPEREDGVLVIGECKLTTTTAAYKKLKNFYIPVVQMVYPKATIRSVQIARNLSRNWDDLSVDSMEEMYDDEAWDMVTWILRDV